jgi:hypothetical protein
VTFTLVDLDGSPVAGYRRDDHTGVVGSISVDVSANDTTIALTPNTEITPATYWQARVQVDGRTVRTSAARFGAGSVMTFPEFLALDETVGFWEVYENRLLPNPEDGAVGSMAAIQTVNGEKVWVVSDAPAGSGTVTSITVTGAGGITVAGSPIASSGTIALDIDEATLKTGLGLGTAAYTASTVYATAAQGTKADTAHGWGNHAGLYDGTGTAAAAVSAHASAVDPHPTYTTAAEAAAAAPVQSVAGRTGAVTLSASDVSGLATVATTGSYADLSSKPTLGTAAALDHGTSAGNLVRLDASTGKLPAVDGSLLTNLPGGSGDATTIQGFAVTTTDPTDGQILVYRTASTAYVLEDKPVAGSNPAASDVSVTPVGAIAATNVQAAIQELDSEKPVLGETSTTAYRGDRGKTAYDHSQSAHAPADATAAGATGDAFATSHLSAFSHANIANGQTAYGWGDHAQAGYAPGSKGVTNGDSHDHSGGDGAQIAYASLSGAPTTWAASAITSGTLDIARIPTGTTGTTTALGNHAHSGVYEPADATIIKQADVDDTPVDGATTAPVSSNWAFDHAASTAPHPNELVPVQLVLSNDDTAIAVGARINRVRIPFAHEVTGVAISCDASSKGSSTALFNAHSINLSTGASTSLLTADISLTSSDQYVAGTLTGTITGSAGAEYGFSCSQASTAKGVMGHLIIKRT